MRSTIVLSALSGLALVSAQTTIVPGVTGALGDAAIVTDNPVGLTYTATLPNSNKTDLRGSISGTATANGTGVQFTVSFSGFPSLALGPFLYHIHDQPVPSNGNCTGTLAHLDPYVRGEVPPCDPSQPQTCQVGDLSGKHGKIAASSFSASYVDLYASTKSGIGAFFGNRSIVLHTANTTRLTCANFTLVSSSNGGGSNATATPSSPGSPPSTGTPVPYTGAAATSGASLMALLAGVAAAALLM